MPKYPTFVGDDSGNSWSAFTTFAVHYSQHAEQPDKGIEAIFAGAVCTKTVFEVPPDSRSINPRPSVKPIGYDDTHPLAVVFPALAPAFATDA